MELQQAIHYTVMLFGFLIDGFKQVGRVYAVNECNIRDDVFDFVGLQVANKVPLDVLRQHFVLVAHLKGMVLAKNALTCIIGFL